MWKTTELIIIAGPSCVGKSTLINRIQQGEVPNLCDQLGIDDPSMWVYIDAISLPKLCYPIQRMVLHYDTYHQYLNNKEYSNVEELIKHSNLKPVFFACIGNDGDISNRTIIYLIYMKDGSVSALNAA
ncbi:MAG: hypothetical protein HQ542_12205 [Bacteroidia bacterium]|nr:hypothetical protein [Bacteroidia bacterium]